MKGVKLQARHRGKISFFVNKLELILFTNNIMGSLHLVQNKRKGA